MWELLKVSVRNVGRNKRRALITMITVFIGVAVLTGARGLLNGLQGEFRSSLTRKIHGDLQIHRRGYQDNLDANPYGLLIPAGASRAQQLSAVAGLQAWTPRLRVMALLNHQKSQTTTPVMITGISSATELRVCPRLKDALQGGELLDSSKEQEAAAVADDDLAEAQSLDEAERRPEPPAGSTPRAVGVHQIMVTPSLMRGMKAEIGDEVVVLLQDSGNMQQAVVATIAGVVDYAMINSASRMAWMDFSTLQKVTGAGDGASEIALRIKDGEDVEAVRAELQAHTNPDEVTETWLELAGIIRDIMGLQNTIFNIVLLIVFVIVVSAIINTSLMTVMERTREIGTLMALGYRRKHILLLFLTEAAVIGLAGGFIGVGFISAVLAILGKRGIVFTLPGQGVPTILYPEVTTVFVLEVLGLSILAALAAGLYPAYKASRLKPVEALASV